MKFSEAMLKGFKRVGGRQCRGVFTRRRGGRVVSCCVLGAAYHGRGDHKEVSPYAAEREFFATWGVSPVELNDKDGMPWEHLYGMAVAAGL